MSLDFIPFADDPDVVQERVKSLVKSSRVQRIAGKRKDSRAEDAAWIAVCKVVNERDEYQCDCCGRKGNPLAMSVLDMLHHHHIVYRSAGGLDTTENLVLFCSECHAAEHAGQLRIIGTNANETLFYEVVEAVVLHIFGRRELPKRVHIVLPNGERQLKEIA
jgi:5-methylcytosine-specific restriction endonuclease McrA